MVLHSKKQKEKEKAKMTHLLGHKRKFGSKIFTAHHTTKKKSIAEDKKKQLKTKGLMVRIVKTKHPHGGHEYYLFTKEMK
jgi:hypothetical protein